MKVFLNLKKKEEKKHADNVIDYAMGLETLPDLKKMGHKILNNPSSYLIHCGEAEPIPAIKQCSVDRSTVCCRPNIER